MARSSPVIVLLLLGLATGSLSAPPAESQQESAEIELLAGGPDGAEAIPSNDFTLFNVSSTIEEVLAEAHVADSDTSDR